MSAAHRFQLFVFSLPHCALPLGKLTGWPWADLARAFSTAGTDGYRLREPTFGFAGGHTATFALA